MEIVLNDLPGITLTGKEVGGEQVDPWRMTTVCKLIAGAHGWIFPAGVKSGHVGIQNTTYEQLLPRKSDGVKWTSRPMEKLHRLLKLGATVQHRAKAIDDQHIFGVQHGESLRIVTCPGVIVNLRNPARSLDAGWAIKCEERIAAPARQAAQTKNERRSETEAVMRRK